MTEQGEFTGRKGVALFLGLVFLASFILKLVNVKVGAPFVTIDDNTTFQGGFLVWFGNAPPQRMYLESWLCGITSLATYVGKALAGQTTSGLNSNLVADAYQDYYNAPDLYVQVYRLFVIMLDMATAWFVYRIGVLVLGRTWRGWAAALAAAMYLFSYNTVWCDVVARPDVLVAFFSTIGLYFYYKSEFGGKQNFFWLAAIFLGLGAGLKLHACLFVAFIALDLLRVHGWRKGLPLAVPMVVISVVFFTMAAGIPLFDPLKYVKLRIMNVKDDASPWITWGEQFYVIVKGSGWFVIPVLCWGAWYSLVRHKKETEKNIGSVIFLAVCWVFLFATIRQLRAYWMLPALPLFYLAFLYAASKLGNFRMRLALVAAVLVLMLAQTAQETRDFQKIEYSGLQTWVRENIQEDEPFYIYGFEAVELPKTSACIAKTRAGLQRSLALDVSAGESYVMRHLKNWEEESTLVLFDMLSGREDQGFTYYSAFNTPLESFEGILDIDQMQFVFVQEGFDPGAHGLVPGYLQDHFELKCDLTGPGGGGRGLNYKVYARKMKP